jgi:phage terminase small subunit
MAEHRQQSNESEPGTQPRKSCHERYVEGLMNGKTKRQAALDAGFSRSQAYHPARSIEGPLTEELMRRAIARTSSEQAPRSRYERYVDGVMDGKTKKQSALDAGFTRNQAVSASRSIEGPITQELVRRVLANAEVTLERLAQKIREGLDATKLIVVAGGSGKEETTKLLTDFETRLKYIQHACRMLHIGDPDTQESTGMRVVINDVYDVKPVLCSKCGYALQERGYGNEVEEELSVL